MLGLTGATGYVGRALLTRIRQAGIPVTTLGRRAVDDAIPHRQLLLDEPAGFREALSGIDALIHLAGLAHHRGSPAAYEQVNIRAAQALADAAISAGCQRMVFVSTLNVVPAGAPRADLQAAKLPRPGDPYSDSKWEAEQRLEAICAGSPLELVLVRPALVHDERLVASLYQLQQMLRRWPLRLPCIGERSLISRPDLVSLLLTVATYDRPLGAVTRIPVSEGGTYDLAAIGSMLCGGQRGWIPVPAWLLRWVASVRDRRQRLPRGSTWRGLAGRKWCAAQPQPAGFVPQYRLGQLNVAEQGGEGI